MFWPDSQESTSNLIRDKEIFCNNLSDPQKEIFSKLRWISR